MGLVKIRLSIIQVHVVICCYVEGKSKRLRSLRGAEWMASKTESNSNCLATARMSASGRDNWSGLVRSDGSVFHAATG
jgi:hypothetical protein